MLIKCSVSDFMISGIYKCNKQDNSFSFNLCIYLKGMQINSVRFMEKDINCLDIW